MKLLPPLVGSVLAAILPISTIFAQSANPNQPMVEDKAGTAAEREIATQKAAVLAEMEGYTHESVMVPLRDGVKLATEIFRPKGKDGPLPVIYQSSPYNRWDKALSKHIARLAPGMDVAIVLQNQRGRFGSEGAGTFPMESFDNEIADTADTMDWIAKQPWCNGKIGMMGVSGSGIGGANAAWTGSPHLVAVNVSITSDNAYDWMYSNGLRRYMHGWFSNRGMPNARAPWPRPVTTPYDAEARKAFIEKQSKEGQAVFTNTTGWFDIFFESSLDTFAARAAHQPTRIVMNFGGHGGTGGDLTFPNPRMPASTFPTFKDRISGKPIEPGTKSELVYYLMGDARDPKAPGNIWKVTDHWPVANTPTSYYLHKDGTLSTQAPTTKGAELSYTYDPKNPVPTLGGNWEFGKNNGPHDQRPLKDRPDVLRFVSEPLSEPMGITGKVRVELQVSTDVPDTAFVVTLVDIYPDGYEALIRQGGMLGRYWQGLSKPAPLEKGRVYALDMDLWSTALVFNRGHRIGLLVTSSSEKAFEVHPNTYEQVSSPEQAAVARQTIHLSPDHPSRLILPVIAPETYLTGEQK